MAESFPYIWHWGPKPDWDRGTPPRALDRKGQRCRVVARGRMNSALVEFADGFRTVTSRSGLRRAGSGCGGTGLILVEGPCDAAPMEAPCPCLESDGV